MIFIYAIIALLITFILVPILIPTLKRMKFGQSIREEGPQSHMKKTGTPTMGGLTFLISIIITSIIAIIFVDHSNPIILLLFVTIGFGLIGFIDDYIIVVKKNNQGLTSKQKFLAQIIIAVIFFVLSDVFHLVHFTTDLHIPFVNFDIPLSFAYVIFIVFWQVGFSNRFCYVCCNELHVRFTGYWHILYYNDFRFTRFLTLQFKSSESFHGRHRKSCSRWYFCNDFNHVESRIIININWFCVCS